MSDLEWTVHSSGWEGPQTHLAQFLPTPLLWAGHCQPVLSLVGHAPFLTCEGSLLRMLSCSLSHARKLAVWSLYWRTVESDTLESKIWYLCLVRMCASARMLPNSNNNQTDQDFGLVQFSHSIMSDSLWLRGLQHARLPCPSPNPGAYSNSCASSQWYHPTISSSVIPFSSHLQSFPASGLFAMSQFFASGGHSIGVSASASVLPMNIQDWFPLGWTGWISLQSRGLSRVFSNNTTFLGAPKILKLRCLLLGRKAMTNLDSILKSRDVTLPTKVRLVKAMVFQ